jgi:glyoxylase-like metal-dependent hydrolase (beta-lactamase superfamily II)
MKLHTVDTGMFKLDGGAMFGVVPKSLWNKQNPADENNLCNWAMRCLLIEDGDKLILIDNGIGDKQDAKFFSHYYLNGDDTLLKSLNKLGFTPEDITHNVLTHLHFDHCGGGIRWNNEHTAFEAVFPNAKYVVGKQQWDLAMHPNAREKASFLKENLLPMLELGQLELVEGEGTLYHNFDIKFVYGHTEGMLIPHIRYKDKTIMYMADLMPAHYYLSPAWVMAYDTTPLVSMKERESFLTEAVDNDYILFFEHDPTIECCTLERTEKWVKIKEKGSLKEML